MKYSISFLAVLMLTPLLLSAGTQAQNAALKNLNARVAKLEKEMKSRKWYNSPAGAAAVKGFHLFVIGEALWFRAEEDGLPFAYKTDNPTGALPENKIRFADLEFTWDLGYRVGGGFTIPHDRWDALFYWTHFVTSSTKHKNAEDGDGLFPYWAFPNAIGGQEFFAKSKGKWELFLNMGDAELGKDYYVGKRLSLRPFAGLRTAWIDQKYKIGYENALFPPSQTLNDQVDMKCDYWGLGPRIGTDMQWWLSKCFNIYATGAISLLYGQFHIKQEEQAQLFRINLEPLHFHDTVRVSRPITDLALGLGIDSLFFDDRLHVGFRVGWEQHVFFDQNQFIRFVNGAINDSTNSLLTNRGDLSLEGVIASLRLDF